MAGLIPPVNALAAMPIFENCSAEELAPLTESLEPLRVETGRVLMRQDEPATSFLLIFTGTARVEHRRGNQDGPGGAVVVNRVSDGMVVGEIALLRGGRRSATVTAETSLSGWIGTGRAFGRMTAIVPVMERLVTQARQRLAAYITPMKVPGQDDLLLRPVLPGDDARALRGAVKFSTDTLYRRFMTPRIPSPSLMHYLAEVDYVDHFGWVITQADGSPIADARFIREGSNSVSAEVAFTVGDAYQGRGLGTFLMGALAVAARIDGVHRFTARVLSDNIPMRTILDRHGALWHRDDPAVVTSIDVPEDTDDGAPALNAEVASQIADIARKAIEALA